VGDAVVGRVTSAGYGYTCGRNVLCAYVAADPPVDAAHSTGYSIEVMGTRHAAQRHARPPYDPERRTILA